MANVKVVMMQRDQGDALVRWLAHYSALFGFANLFILDNGSEDALTLSALREAERRGARIYRGLDRLEDYIHKAGHVMNVIRGLDGGESYDFALPVECDEILAVFDEAGLTTAADAIHAELDRLRGVQTALRVDLSLFTVPDRPEWFAPVRAMPKGFLPARSMESIDNHYQNPRTRLATGFESVRLAFLNWNGWSYEGARRRALRLLEGRVDLSDAAALEAALEALGPRAPYVRAALLEDENAFRQHYAGEVLVHVSPGGRTNFLDIGSSVVSWDAESYLRENPDVRSGYTLTALHHYLMSGFREGRRLDALF